MTNHLVNFGWEYVRHCHILSHEEMDMMRSQAVGVAPAMPSDLGVHTVGSGTSTTKHVTWVDGSANETDWVVQRTSDGTWETIATEPSSTGPDVDGTVEFDDEVGDGAPEYMYRVQALNVVGDTTDYGEGNDFPTLRLTSDFLTVTPCASDPDEPANDTVAGAVPLADGETVEGELCPDGDVDYYSIDAQAGETVVSTLTWDSQGGTVPMTIQLLDADGETVLDEVVDSTSGSESVSTHTLVVEHTGTANPAVSGTSFITLDAVEALAVPSLVHSEESVFASSAGPWWDWAAASHSGGKAMRAVLVRVPRWSSRDPWCGWLRRPGRIVGSRR